MKLQEILTNQLVINKDLILLYQAGLLPDKIRWQLENQLLSDEYAEILPEFSKKKAANIETNILKNIQTKFEQQHSKPETKSKPLFKTPFPSLDMEKILQQLMEKAIPLLRYEKMLNLNMRNHAGSQVVSIIQPQLNSLCINKVTFQMEYEGSPEMELRLFNEKGRRAIPVQKIPSQSKSYVLDLKNYDKVSAGLHYWQLIVKGADVVTGKIYIYIH